MTLLLRVFDNKVSTLYIHTYTYISMFRSVVVTMHCVIYVVAMAVYSDWLLLMQCAQC
jgi:hypothetical protein